MSNTTEVRIPTPVAAKIQERIQGTGFRTVDEFVTFVLARLLESSSDVPFSEEEEKRLKDRLRSLGYID